MAYSETRIAELEADVHELANEAERLRSELAEVTEVPTLPPVKAALRAYAAASKHVPCPICGGIEGCDDTVRERLLADLGIRAALQPEEKT